MAKASFLKHAAIYGAGDLLVYAAGFLLLPLYVRCLNPGEYGALDVLNRLGEVVLLCLLFKGLRQAMFSFHNLAETEDERRTVIGTALLTTLLFLGIGGGAAALAAEPLCESLELGSPDVLRLAVVAVFLESFSVLLLSLAQARQEPTLFVLTSAAQFLIRVVLCIALVKFADWGIAGVLTASAIASGATALWLLVRELSRGGLRVNYRKLREMLLFSLPFVPGGIGFFLMNSGDRFFLLNQVSRAELGAYALGYKLALIVKMFSRQPLYRVWSARMYEAARKPDAAVLFGKVFTRILAVYVGVGLGLCLVAGEVVNLLAGADYAPAATIITPVVLAYYFLTAADLMESGFYIRRHTAWKLPITLMATLVTITLYGLMIPHGGIEGAALATLFGLAFTALITGIASQRVFPVQYEWLRVSLCLGAAIGVWFLGGLMPMSLWLLPIKAGLWLLWLGFVWVAVMSQEEKQWARRLPPAFPNAWSRVARGKAA